MGSQCTKGLWPRQTPQTVAADGSASGALLQVRILGIDGEAKFSVDAELTWTVFRLTSAIRAAEGTPEVDQKLVRGTAELVSDSLLSDVFGIQDKGVTKASVTLVKVGGLSTASRQEFLTHLEEADHVSAEVLFRDALPAVHADRLCTLAAVKKNGNSLQYASDELRADKEVVMAAVVQTRISLGFGVALKYARGQLHSEVDCLKASGLWDEPTYSRSEQAVLSFKFSMVERSGPLYATVFAEAMKRDPYFSNFKMSNPKLWCRESCDPTVTDINHRCWGTVDTCSVPKHPNLTADNRPQSTSCWRVGFRFCQQQSKDTNGFMIQVEEPTGLSDSQKIEIEMAEQVRLKVFRVQATTSYWDDVNFHKVPAAVEAWYNSGCADNSLETFQI